MILTVPLHSKSAYWDKNKRKPAVSHSVSKPGVLLFSYANPILAGISCHFPACSCCSVQLSSSDAWLCRFITKQQLAQEKKNPTPILIQLSKTEKQPGFVLGKQRARAFGCRFSGRAAPPQWDPFPWKPASTQLFPQNKGTLYIVTCTYSCHRGWAARRGWWGDGDAWRGTRWSLCKVKRKTKRGTCSAEEKKGGKKHQA